MTKIQRGHPLSVESNSASPNRPPLYVAQPPLNEHGRPRIQRVMIANRGEIACRVIETCHKLNVTTIAVYVEEDSLSRHVRDADEAINLGNIDQEGGNPFLNIDLLVRTALNVNADAIHPGYGYLSENADFATAVKKAGLIFIGPSPEAMTTLGDKRKAKEYLRQNEPRVPLIPGFAGSSQEPQELEKAAAQIGYPVILKASAGGGGRGMRIVREASKLQTELNSARSEAERSFGSGDCILEKYIEAGKHIEIQVMGDSHANVISLSERDCSVQRRHQKVVEESPSPWLTPEKRREMSDVAVCIAKLLGYENAGTVEFVVDVISGQFYFLEVNARLQVEHPITEEVTGIDLVALQLFVAAGGDLATLPIPDVVPQHGHAIECRLCAEDPEHGFFPEHGTIRLWQAATETLPGLKDVRFETAVVTGSDVSIYFDSMIAKFVVWAPTRSLAIEKMATMLSHTACLGVRTNQSFLRNCLLHSEFRNPSYTTSFIADNLESLLAKPQSANIAGSASHLALIPSLFLCTVGEYLPAISERPHFRNVRRGFRNQYLDPVNITASIVTVGGTTAGNRPLLCQSSLGRHLRSGQVEFTIQAVPEIESDPQTESKSAASQITARYNKISNVLRTPSNNHKTSGKRFQVEIASCHAATATSKTRPPWITAELNTAINGISHHAILATETCDTGLSSTTQAGQGQRVFIHFPSLGTNLEFTVYNLLSYCESLRTIAVGSEASLKAIKAPMPCKVLSVLKKNGDEVTDGEIVMVVESMKMEMNISVSVAGVFEALVKKGDAVDEGVLLCRVT